MSTEANIFQLYSIMKIFDSNVKEKIKIRTEFITSYYLFSLKYQPLFEGNYFEDVYPTIFVLDWITKYKEEFQRFLLDEKEVKSIIKQNRITYKIDLIDDLPYQIEKVKDYINSFDKIINEDIRRSVLNK